MQNARCLVSKSCQAPEVDWLPVSFISMRTVCHLTSDPPVFLLHKSNYRTGKSPTTRSWCRTFVRAWRSSRTGWGQTSSVAGRSRTTRLCKHCSRASTTCIRCWFSGWMIWRNRDVSCWVTCAGCLRHMGWLFASHVLIVCVTCSDWLRHMCWLFASGKLCGVEWKHQHEQCVA